MVMMIETLNKRINEMKDLRRLVEMRDNKAAQDAVDLKFKGLTAQIHLHMQALQYVKDKLQFQLSDTTLSSLENVLVEHRDSVQSGFAEKDRVDKTDADFKGVIQSIKKEWSSHYLALTNATISTLRVISRIDSEQVTRCLEGISKGEIWTVNTSDYKTMSVSLANAKTMIAGLSLDQNIIYFLQKMNNGKATVEDLDEKVMNWLKNESLEKRVRLSFTGSAKKN